MSGGQIAALLFAVILLIPGGCFLVMGVGMLSDKTDYGGLTQLALGVGVGLLVLVFFLGRFAFRKRKPPQTPA
jgi:hypothetical protein